MKQYSAIIIIVALISGFSLDADAKDYVTYKPEISIPLTSAGLSVWLFGEIFKGSLAPERCRFCRRNFLDEEVKRLISWGTKRNAADMWSNVVLVSIPLAGLGSLSLSGRDMWDSSDAAKETGKAALVYFESLSVAMFLNQVVKFIVARERPIVRHLSGSEKDRPDTRLSFYSGHTTAAFAMATAGSMLLQMKEWKYSNAAWVVNMSLAATVGYLRIAADKHYFSDVIIGALIGIAAGIIVPKLHEIKESDSQKKSFQITMPAPLYMFSIGTVF